MALGGRRQLATPRPAAPLLVAHGRRTACGASGRPRTQRAAFPRSRKPALTTFAVASGGDALADANYVPKGNVRPSIVLVLSICPHQFSKSLALMHAGLPIRSDCSC